MSHVVRFFSVPRVHHAAVDVMDADALAEVLDAAAPPPPVSLTTTALEKWALAKIASHVRFAHAALCSLEFRDYCSSECLR